MISGVRYCGGVNASPLSMLGAWIKGPKSDLTNWRQLPGRHVLFTHKGRGAIALAAKALNLKAGDEVLVPAYNCGAEVEALVYAGLRVILYRVDSSARIDLEDAARRKTNRTRALYIIHYFGWAHSLQAASAWCQRENVLLIEDCALALFSPGPDGKTGRSGAAAIFSFGKTIPVPDGGMLTLRDNAAVAPVPLPTVAIASVFGNAMTLSRSYCLQMADRLKFYSGAHTFVRLKQRLFQRRSRRRHHPDIPPQYAYQGSEGIYSISRLSAGLLSTVSAAQIRETRRKNYTLLLSGIQGTPGVNVLHADLPPDVCPLQMPILVGDRRQWMEKLLLRGVHAIPWWQDYTRRDLSWHEFPEACYLKDHLLALPVHQGLDPSLLNYVARSVRQVSDELHILPRPRAITKKSQCK